MWMQTYTGRKFDFDNIESNVIVVEDIAHALALTNRFGGHTIEPYSVAQHSCVVSDLCSEQNKLYGLLHDAPEAYMGDAVTPLKTKLGVGFEIIEDRIWRRICKITKLAPMLPAEVLEIDKRVLANEALLFRTAPIGDWHLRFGEVQNIEALKWVWGWRRAKSEFMARFTELFK